MILIIFIYLCFNILSSVMRLIISSPPLSHNVFSLDATLGWLLIFLSYYLVGYRFAFAFYSFLFISRLSQNFVFEFIAFNRVEFSFFHGIVELKFLLFVGWVFLPILSQLSVFYVLTACNNAVLWAKKSETKREAIFVSLLL